MDQNVVPISSGAIGVGLQHMAMPPRPKTLPGKQASQNKGQALFSPLALIALSDNLFGQLGQPVVMVTIMVADIQFTAAFISIGHFVNRRHSGVTEISCGVHN